MRVFPNFTGPMITWPRVEAIPSASSTLALLQPHFIICLATNAADSNEAEIRSALARVELEHYFDHVFCYRKIGYQKPQPEFFRFIVEELDLPLSNIVMIGDDYEVDILSAVSYGLRAVWLRDSSNPVTTHPQIQVLHSLDQLPTALSNFFRGKHIS